MALETVVYPRDSSTLSYDYKDNFYGGSGWSYNLVLQEEGHDQALLESNNIHQTFHANYYNRETSSSTPPNSVTNQSAQDQLDQPSSSPKASEPLPAMATRAGQRKRRRSKSSKNKEEIENQRMTHIAVERNRRKQMNQYLAVLRSMMPPSYVQRGDQASIIGGAINYVKELEHHLQFMEAHNMTKQQQPDNCFAEFFTFPQYSTRQTQCQNLVEPPYESMSQNQTWAVADIEVNNMVDSHANLKILCKKRPKQLFKMVFGFQALRLCVLHLNITTVGQMVLYSISVKVDEGCQLNTVDEIAAAVNQMLRTIDQEEASFSS